jgi:hypothetical protein
MDAWFAQASVGHADSRGEASREVRRPHVVRFPIQEHLVSSFTTTLTHMLEALLVFLGTFVVALTIMSVFGDIGATELRLALLESVVSFVVWTRYIQRPV